MILRPFNLKKIEKSGTLSPKGIKKPTYMRLKTNRQKSSKGGRSLCSIQTYHQSNSLSSRRMLSHRKLISGSSLQQKQTLTERKYTVESQKVVSSRKNKNQQQGYLNRNKFHLNKFYQNKNQKLHTILNQQNEQTEKVLQIKQNILKQFIDRFQEQLRQISQQKQNKKTILTHRMKTQSSKDENRKYAYEKLKQQTTKKQRNPKIDLNNSTINIQNGMQRQSLNNKQNEVKHDNNDQQNKFKSYLKQIQDHRRKDKKIFIVKNHKKSLQNISISKIGQSENLRKRQSHQRKNNNLNLKELFKHSKKYQPYLKDSETLCLSPRIIEQIKQKQQYLQKSELNISGIKKINSKDENYHDCSSIQKINQSSFISEVGRNTILKHLQKQSIKILKDQQKKSKKCLTKLKNIFPTDFF